MLLCATGGTLVSVGRQDGGSPYGRDKRVRSRMRLAWTLALSYDLRELHFRKSSEIWYNTPMKIDDRCIPYAEEMKTCGYCAEGEYLAVFGIKICELGATKLYLFKEQSHRGRVIVASKLHVSEITALSDEERNAFFADVNRVAKALHAVFKPVKVNYGAYGDTGHHLHFHLVPKYSDDAFEWGGVFAMNPKRKFLSAAEYEELVAAIKSALEK